ncbi:MAG: aspartate aminotransferase family protein, partial [Xanthomonadaceae bacterium]|nr:aspartate aminotransferase family protein [Xanthomonadaceae bacterium]
MRADRLRELLATLEGPTIVCAQAGNVNTGAFDPLQEIGAITNASGAWLHIDGAFGLWARTSRRHRALAEGIELAGAKAAISRTAGINPSASQSAPIHAKLGTQPW